MRPVVGADLELLAALNDAAVPNVNALGLDGLAPLVERSELALTVEDCGVPAALLVAFAPGADYASENYAWFSVHQPPSLYVDRIVVGEALRGRGIGAALYESVFDHATGLGLGLVTCEVNLDPPNPRSLAFHERLGFTQVGTQRTTGGTVEVALLARATST
ncbi:MAG: GNAT family N-acetyltransferase [Actinomycetales bacterium]|nr:GNAT family N-acetyltransferase [Actinomycetales bacterium]